MTAMVSMRPGAPLERVERPLPHPGVGELLVRVEACAVCRTDLHVIDDELPAVKRPIVPGHEIVGRVEALGSSTEGFQIGQRVGIPWLGHTCGHCAYCRADRENLCDDPEFTGYTRDGGFATHVAAHSDFVLDLSDYPDPVATAPLLCAGLIGWRSLVAAGAGTAVGIFGFGAAAHIIAQVCRWQGRRVFAFTRAGDKAAQDLARSLGAVWAGASADTPPEQLDCAIIFAPAGELVPRALKLVKKGGRVVCGGIHMSDIPSFPYRDLWEEREIVSVANLTRKDGHAFLSAAKEAGVKVHTTRYPLAAANNAIADLRSGRLVGAAVLVP
jgi:propanol-preferring alcohol dehydrogenase